MLRSLTALENYTAHATDGDAGTVVDFLFDDEHWAVRHIVVKTSESGHSVLVAPVGFRAPSFATKRFELAATTEQIWRTRPIDLDVAPTDAEAVPPSSPASVVRFWGPAEAGDTRLRSSHSLHKYHVHATDGLIGHIDDFIVDDESWRIRYLVVDTSNWWFGKKVLVPPYLATGISWADKLVYIDLSCDDLRVRPEWNPAAGVNQVQETRLYDYYGRPVEGDVPESPPTLQSEYHHG